MREHFQWINEEGKREFTGNVHQWLLTIQKGGKQDSKSLLMLVHNISYKVWLHQNQIKFLDLTKKTEEHVK